jgi:IPT/TIG domain
MTWSLHPAGSWGVATTDTPSEMSAALALPGSWPWYPTGAVLVRKDQWANLVAVPEVDSIDPATGPATGGTGVAISGSGLIGSTGVTFGGTPATSPIVNSDGLITCITAAHAAGAVPVVVLNPRGNVTRPDGFTYT